MKFKGSLEDLKHILEINAVKGNWTKTGAADQFRSNNGGIINLFLNGTINFQGQSPDKENIISLIQSYIDSKVVGYGAVASEPSPVYGSSTKTKVFVVYGHDTQSREQLELILHKLELEPFVLANKSGNGMTIIEALENEITSDVAGKCKFGIVLLTPDDMGYAKKDGETKAEPRARQNVVLEMGMLISSLKRSNVAILKKGHLEVPSDANGIIYLPFNDHVKEVVPRLVERLQTAGINISAKAVANASS